jgi:prepilin-type processing-associated H-X9-DG protein
LGSFLAPSQKQGRFAGGVSPVEESLWPNTLSPAIVGCPAHRRNGRAFGTIRLPLENTRFGESVNMLFFDGM